MSQSVTKQQCPYLFCDKLRQTDLNPFNAVLVSTWVRLFYGCYPSVFHGSNGKNACVKVHELCEQEPQTLWLIPAKDCETLLNPTCHTMTTQTLYDLKAAALYLKLSTHGVRYALRSGHLNKLQPRPGSKIRFTQAMLDEYLSGKN